MNLRSLTRGDIPFLVSARKTFSDAWDENMLLSAFRAGNFYGFVAEKDADGKSVPIGFITFSQSSDAADMQDLFVSEPYREKGVGKSLVSAFISAAGEKGAKKLFLEVRESNFSAINLYKAMGFKFLSVRKKYYSDGENAQVFIKEL